MDGTDGGIAAGGRDATFDSGELANVCLRMRERLRRTALRLLRDGHEADDVVQEAMLAAFSNHHRLRDPERLEGWLLRIARNLAATRRRRGLRMRPDLRLSVADPESLGPAGELGVLLSNEPGPDAVLAFRNAWEALPPRWRDACRERFVRGRSFGDIAAEHGVSVGCVKTRLSRVRKRLREAL